MDHTLPAIDDGFPEDQSLQHVLHFQESLLGSKITIHYRDALRKDQAWFQARRRVKKVRGLKL